jgi:hypothetical protein
VSCAQIICVHARTAAGIDTAARWLTGQLGDERSAPPWLRSKVPGGRICLPPYGFGPGSILRSADDVEIARREQGKNRGMQDVGVPQNSTHSTLATWIVGGVVVGAVVTAILVVAHP